MSTRLSNDEFLANLNTLLTTTHSASHGSIYLTQKALPSSSISSPDTSADTSSSAPPQILLRASNGVSKKQRQQQPKTKIRLSTVIDSHSADAFYARYAEVCKKGMEGLRKRDKKKAKEKAKKRKGKGAGEK